MSQQVASRVAMPAQDPKTRNKNFSEVALGYTEEMALEEASRCLLCPKPQCVKGCPVEVDTVSYTHLDVYKRQGLTMTLFSAVLTISGSFAAAPDGVTLRTAKFFFGNMIPVAGKLFADVLDTAAGSALLLKNTMGVAGMAAVLAITALPLLRIFIQSFLLKLVSALAEPLGDERAGPMLEEIGNALMLIFTVLGAMAIMTILTLSAILMASNTAVTVSYTHLDVYKRQVLGLALAAALFFRCWPAFGRLPSESRRRGYAERTKYYERGRFRNSGSFVLIDRTAAKEKTAGPRRPAGKIPVIKREGLPPAGAGELAVTWFGHSTILLELGGKNFLTDPVLSQYSSPAWGIGPKRLAEPPMTARQLPEIDLVLLSHDHFDHLDYRTIRAIDQKVKAYCVPLGVELSLIHI